MLLLQTLYYLIAYNFVQPSDHPWLLCCAVHKKGRKEREAVAVVPTTAILHCAKCSRPLPSLQTAPIEEGERQLEREGGREHRERPMGIRLHSAVLRSINCMLSSSATFTYPLHGIIL